MSGMSRQEEKTCNDESEGRYWRMSTCQGLGEGNDMALLGTRVIQHEECTR